jgi:hypothetical protein
VSPTGLDRPAATELLPDDDVAPAAITRHSMPGTALESVPDIGVFQPPARGGPLRVCLLAGPERIARVLG